ncbi:MAG: hypothetical protein ACRDWD_05570, partial [Acidimicrobiia bacterium]
MAENTEAEQRTSRATSDFVAFTASQLGVFRSESRLWVIDPGHTENQRRSGIRVRALAPWLISFVLVVAAGGTLPALFRRSIATYTQA